MPPATVPGIGAIVVANDVADDAAETSPRHAEKGPVDACHAGALG